jgi:hypothetical protein
MSYPPTDEQRAAMEIAATGASCVIQALAGSGKTSTLRMIAEAQPGRRYQFVAFNKAIVSDVQGSFPSNVACSTAHSLAYRNIGTKYAHRLKQGRMRSDEIARRLRVDRLEFNVLGTKKVLAAGFLGGLIKRSVDLFCQTDDPEPTTAHVPFVPGLDEPRIIPADSPGGMPIVINRKGPNHAALTLALEPAMKRYWADVMDVNGVLPYSHGCYLKQWELDDPIISTDTILFDEGQDASPVMLSIVSQQDAQLILVGDSYQSIYGWTGAIDALERADPEAPRTWLTRSFRFGPEIAEQANVVLASLGAPVSVEGSGPAGTVGPLESPDTILFRTNAKAVATALQELRAGKRVALVGGAEDVVAFARAAEQLKDSGRCYHPELQCFTSWGEVQDYVSFDPNGSELKLLVDLVDEFGADVIQAEMQRCTDEARAEVVLSTAHKSKGREWAGVQLAGDFPDPENREVSDEDKRLLYVAATRAKLALDVESVGFFNPKKGVNV